MKDEDLTGPSRVLWQLIGLAVLLVVIVVYGVAPWLSSPAAPPTAKVINWADLPAGTPCSCPAAVKP